MIDEILKSDEIKSEIRKNSIDEKYIISIKCSLKDKIVEKNEIMNEEEIKNFIKVELEKASEEQEKIRIAEEQEKARLAKEREMRRKQQEKIKMNGGGYCSWRCKHYYEEFLDSRGGIIGNFDSGGYVEYYCRLGHSIADGCFCKDFE